MHGGRIGFESASGSQIQKSPLIGGFFYAPIVRDETSLSHKISWSRFVDKTLLHILHVERNFVDLSAKTSLVTPDADTFGDRCLIVEANIRRLVS